MKTSAKGLLPESRAVGTPEECHQLCRRTGACLQWEWRYHVLTNIKYMSSNLGFFVTVIHSCRLFKEWNKVVKEKNDDLISVVGTKLSCKKEGGCKLLAHILHCFCLAFCLFLLHLLLFCLGLLFCFRQCGNSPIPF